MSQVIPFRQAPPATTDIVALSARLLQVETAETTDEALLDLLLEAELSALAALARARALSVAEVALKLATVVRRLGEDRDAALCDDEVRLLRSALRDLQHLPPASPNAARA